MHKLILHWGLQALKESKNHLSFLNKLILLRKQLPGSLEPLNDPYFQSIDRLFIEKAATSQNKENFETALGHFLTHLAENRLDNCPDLMYLMQLIIKNSDGYDQPRFFVLLNAIIRQFFEKTKRRERPSLIKRSNHASPEIG